MKESVIPLFQRLLVVIRAEDPNRWYRLGVAYSRWGAYGKAIQALEHTLHLDPAHDDAMEVLGDIYLHRGDPEAAVEYYSDAAALDLWHRNPHRWNNLGIAYGKLGNFNKEIAAFEQALKINPKNVTSWRNLVTSYYNARRFTDVAAVCEKALAELPTVPEFWYDLGHALEALNRLADAERAYREFWKLRPNYPAAWSHLLRVLIQEDKLDDAELLCPKISSQSRREGLDALTQICEGLIWKGEFTRAEQLLVRGPRLSHPQLEKLRNLWQHKNPANGFPELA